MSTDMLLTVDQGMMPSFRPFTVKYFDELKKQRTKEKLEIERRYWASPTRNLVLKILTERHVSAAFVMNMLWVHPYFLLSALFPLKERDVNRIAAVLTHIILNEELPLRIVAHRCDRILRLEAGTGLAVIRHLIAIRYWEVDMNTLIRTNVRLILLNSPQGSVYIKRRAAA